MVDFRREPWLQRHEDPTMFEIWLIPCHLDMRFISYGTLDDAREFLKMFEEQFGVIHGEVTARQLGETLYMWCSLTKDWVKV